MYNINGFTAVTIIAVLRFTETIDNKNFSRFQKLEPILYLLIFTTVDLILTLILWKHLIFWFEKLLFQDDF